MCPVPSVGVTWGSCWGAAPEPRQVPGKEQGGTGAPGDQQQGLCWHSAEQEFTLHQPHAAWGVRPSVCPSAALKKKAC